MRLDSIGVTISSVRESSSGTKAAKGIVQLQRVSDDSRGRLGLEVLEIPQNGTKKLLMLSDREVRHDDTAVGTE